MSTPIALFAVLTVHCFFLARLRNSKSFIWLFATLFKTFSDSYAIGLVVLNLFKSCQYTTFQLKPLSVTLLTASFLWIRIIYLIIVSISYILFILYFPTFSIFLLFSLLLSKYLVPRSLHLLRLQYSSLSCVDRRSKTLRLPWPTIRPSGGNAS